MKKRKLVKRAINPKDETKAKLLRCKEAAERLERFKDNIRSNIKKDTQGNLNEYENV